MKKKSSRQNPFPTTAEQSASDEIKPSKAAKPAKAGKAIKSAKVEKPAKAAKSAKSGKQKTDGKQPIVAPAAPRLTLLDGKRETAVEAQVLRISFGDGRQLSLDLTGKAGTVAMVASHADASQRASLTLHPEHYDSLALQIRTDSAPPVIEAVDLKNDGDIEAALRPQARRDKLDIDLAVQYGEEITAAQRKALPKRKLIAEWLGEALFADAELTVRFVGPKEGRELNKQFRHKDYATNVLTFSYDDMPNGGVSGDLVLCCSVVESEAREQGKPLTAHYAHLLVHGALHAQGYDHERGEDEAAEMEALEIDILDQLGFPNPYV